MEKLEWWLYKKVIKTFENMFTRFDTIHERDRQTDIRTDRHRNISSKSIHAFLSNLAHRQTNRQTDKRTWAKAFTSSFVGGKLYAGYYCRTTNYMRHYAYAIAILSVRPSVRLSICS